MKKLAAIKSPRPLVETYELTLQFDDKRVSSGQSLPQEDES